MIGWMRPLLLLWLGVASSGCFRPDFGNGRTPCEPNTQRCPDGYQCILGDCWRLGAGPDMAPLVVGPPIVTLSAPHGARMHINQKLLITATLSNLPVAASGSATFTPTSGSLTAPSCTAPQAQSSICTAVYTPAAVGQDTVTVVSTQGGVVITAMITVHIAPRIQLSLAPHSLDILGFGTPEALPSLHATVSNLFDFDSPRVSFDIPSNSSFQASRSGDTDAIVTPTISDFPTLTALNPGVISATSDADPEASDSVTVQVHAWTDESGALATLFGTGAHANLQLWSAGVASNGDLVVAGRMIGTTSSKPIAAYRAASSGMWQVALNGYGGADGVITGVTTGANNDFILVGVTGPADGNGNRALLELHCLSNSLLCTSVANGAPAEMAYASAIADGAWRNVVAPGDSSLPVTVNPNVASCTTGNCNNTKVYMSLTYTNRGSGCGMASNSHGNILSYGLDSSPPYSHWFEDPTYTPPTNVCPFVTNQGDRIMISNVNNVGNAFSWLSGYADCGTPSCNANTDPYAGLIANINGTAQFRNYEDDATSAHGPTLRRGYDDSIIAISSLSGGASDPGAHLLWYPSSPTFPLHGPAPAPSNPPAGAVDVGVVANGSPLGGSRWSPNAQDLFYSLIRRDSTNTSFQLNWVQGTAIRQVTTGTSMVGSQVLDLAFTGSGASAEGWAIGHVLVNGAPAGPLLAHLH